MQPKKDTIYLEAEDEITTVIDKLQSAKSNVVALVLPKQASVFQSVVNMKLLMKAAKRSKKQPVLVTSNQSIIKLAGLSGVPIAKSLSSKPEVPSSDQLDGESETPAKIVEEAVVADAAGNAAVAEVVAEPDTIELDNTSPKGLPITDKKIGKKVIKIPDFSSFRTKVVLFCMLLVLAIVGSVFAFVILPKATIIVKTDTKSVSADLQILASTAATEMDQANSVVPAELAESAKSDSEVAPATGTKNIGEKASGTMTIVNCNKDDESITAPAGTVFSAGGFNFVTTAAVTVAASNFTGGGLCKRDKSASVEVAASEPGDNYNLTARSYSTTNSDLSGSGSAMTGGTNNVVKVVTAADISSAKDRLVGRSKSAALDEINSKLISSNKKPLEQTLEEGEPKVEASVAADSQAESVKVTVTTVYKMLGVKQEDLKALLEMSIKKAAGENQQNIQDDGLSAANYLLIEKKSVTEQKISLKTIATVGPKVDEVEIAKLSAGKKRGDIEQLLRAKEGIRDVTVEYSPFWVLTTPKSASKIKVVLEQTR
jgi:hypothetical protein